MYIGVVILKHVYMYMKKMRHAPVTDCYVIVVHGQFIVCVHLALIYSSIILLNMERTRALHTHLTHIPIHIYRRKLLLSAIPKLALLRLVRAVPCNTPCGVSIGSQ